MMMELYAHDYSLERISFNFYYEELSILEQNNCMIDSFFLLIKDWFEPYSLDFQLNSYKYQDYYQQTRSFYQAIQLIKENLNKEVIIKPYWNNSLMLNVNELNGETVKKNIDLHLSKNYLLDELIGIRSINCIAGAFKFPINTFIKELSLRNDNNRVSVYPTKMLNNSIWIEAPIKNTGTLWTPIEFALYKGLPNLTFDLNLNWDLYTKRNIEGHRFLNNCLNRLLSKGWIKSVYS